MQAFITSLLSTITHLWHCEQVYILVFSYSKCSDSELWLNKVCYCKRRVKCSWVENLSCSSDLRSSYECNMSKGCTCNSTLWELNECCICKWSSTVCPICSFHYSLTCIVCICCFIGNCCSCFSWVCCIECEIKICTCSPWGVSTLKDSLENVILGCIGLRHSVKIKG